MWRDPSPHEVTINKTETGNFYHYHNNDYTKFRQLKNRQNIEKY